MAPAIPDRWLDYTPIGKQIEGTRFIAFKVPLKEHLNKSILRHQRLDANILLEKIPNLGIIIDLTNTNRYYNPQQICKNGVDYKKICTPGRVTPPSNLVKEFRKCVKDFLTKNSSNGKR
uniref:Tyrosine-protein phosphatase domain-containing protein n=1 Tax=Glossina brevipalpis TaxID=37001 RepID=A0A1A9WW36_9MUSC